jgi:hypothetical protein
MVTVDRRGAAETVIEQINKLFAGTGIPVAKALGADALRIREVLDEPNLPALVGAASRDQMIRSLGISVGAEYVRTEHNVTRFALSVVAIPKVGSGDEELAYLSQLDQLGKTIPWGDLESKAAASARKGKSREEVSATSGDRFRGGDDGSILPGYPISDGR